MNKEELIKRGLADLLEENQIENLEKEEVIDIELDKIAPNPFQPRRHFDEQAMQELADSIRSNGVLQPVIVKKVANGYLLVAGERRCRASKIAGFSTVPAIIRDYNNQYLAELALLENIQREDLSIVEEAEAYQNAIQSLNLTHLELAQKIGKSRSYVSNALGILTLPKEVLEEINKGNISMGHARSLSKLKDVSRIRKIAALIIQERLTVRDIESLVKKEEKKNKIKRKAVPQELQGELSGLKDKMNTSFKFKEPIKITSNKIVITIHDLNEVEKIKKILSGDDK
ncbi:MAG: ParB/RepB/Spo0J family partition protein [Candidatus Izemoplasmatales bacterium]|nr:ParB/RepB/Spo0J family partition protein [Candidatus Izemoplasmatales bacterium]MDD4069001.1 ParB/RepB/Spo0J family partition protein [Candidatus Izemoplasmatales bacterium]MDY0138228.1 ParB/RepB/Spo0J family partition protein [Candidatus Izemoplasmatales bacterium]